MPVHRCRQAKNLSVEQVREYLRLGSLQAIYKWEEGRGYPQTDNCQVPLRYSEHNLKDKRGVVNSKKQIKSSISIPAPV